MVSVKKDLGIRIKKIKDTIKKKHRKLRNRSFQLEREAEIKYKPLIEPIKQLFEKRESKFEDYVEPKPIYEDEKEEVEPVQSGTELEEEEEGGGEDEEEQVRSGTEWATYAETNNIGNKVAKYLEEYVNDSGDYNLTYGIQWNSMTNEWKLGQYTVMFQGNNFVIDNVTYPATDGLLKLVLLREPKHYDTNDLTTYKKLLNHTNAHLKSDGKINTNSGFKYKNIIKKLFPPKRGKGVSAQYFMDLTTSRIDYRHWDNPNELVDRLRLLIASKQAGHTGHNNEITSILEELQDAGIIKDFNHLHF